MPAKPEIEKSAAKKKVDPFFFRIKGVQDGKPANGLIWHLERTIGNQLPPTEDRFVIKDGRKVLNSTAFRTMIRRQKDIPPAFYNTVYNQADYTETEDGQYDVLTWNTPRGQVTGRLHNSHFTEYPVKTIDDVDVWTFLYENMAFQANPVWFERNTAEQVNFDVNWSPVQQLLQFDMGMENFYCFLADEPERMERLITAMHERFKDRLRLGLSLFKNASWMYCAENTSSTAISPAYYRKLTLPHIREYARIAHEKNVRLIVHMCGLLKDLADCFPETGMDGIDSVTPPPLGDTPYKLIRDTCGQDFTIIGRLNACLWVGKSKSEIQSIVRRQIYLKLLTTPFWLMVSTDALSDIPYDDVMNLYDALETMEW
ncbi:MAG: uroporphyrinogen decarboxylase family protein [Kiritimatiellales bacterium]